MHKIKIFIALLLGIGIVRGLARRYQGYPDRQLSEDSQQPVRDKVVRMVDGLEFSSSRSGETTIPSPAKEKKTKRQLHEDFSTGQLQISALSAIIDPLRIYGVTDPEIVLIQYCDFNSRYCVQGYEEEAIRSYEEAFPGQVGYTYKPYPRNAELEVILPHQAASCVEQLGTPEQFLSYYDKLYQNNDALDINALMTYAEELQVDGFDNCLRNHNPLSLQQDMKTGRDLFKFASLPANVFINTKTGNRILVPGLYELEEVTPAIAYLLQ